ncbi:type I pullulanase [Kandleria sp.]|uniref:type I pullulanase n=1 Tax=Kandleria sp. TaxID=2774291 RepID=UPI001B6D4BA2|nr:type I pullulanase [Kandleria sp.]MBP3276035.1 type I pullulanase [Kandleria sp.]
MQQESARMYAYAISFDTIKVYLSKNYYNGISSKFYLKDLETSEHELLHGDTAGEEDGYNTYLFHTSFKIGKSYRVSDAYGLTCFLDFSRLPLCKEFDDHFYYDGDDLGPAYTPYATSFKVWAPTATSVIVKLKHYDDIKLYEMKRLDKGVFALRIFKDLENYEYTYFIGNNDQVIESCDPYAYASTSNQRSSIIVDLNKIRKKTYDLPPLEHKTDAVIYELHVRNFSVDSYGNLRHKGKFLAFAEEGNKTMMNEKSGVDYLEDLGVTHIQLMPINDYATVDEDHPYELYNWGYDPAQYNVTEGSYVTIPNDGYRRIQECRDMIDAIHKHGMRVIPDVVYNHMHDIFDNALAKTVPHYFFRTDENGYLTNGTWCGNDMNSTAKMCRKYILDMCKRWQTLYGVDGYRMDLMGILDVETVNAIEEQGRSIDPSFMLYGEGWNMGTLPIEEKAIIENNGKMPQVGFFNDFFRDTMRGNNQMEIKGYTSGDTYKTNEAIFAMCDYNKFSSIEQSINYVECHDNATVYDKFVVCNRDEGEDYIRRRCDLALVMTLLSQGVPFLHAGEEFYDTKKGNANSYNAGDEVNQFDWGRRDQNMKTVHLVKDLIRLRKENKCFRYYDFEDMRNHISINNINHRMIEYILTQDEGSYHEFRIYVNPSLDNIGISIEDSFKILQKADHEEIQNGYMNVAPCSFVIAAR